MKNMTPNELFNKIERSFTDASCVSGYLLLHHFFGREAQTQLTDMHISLGGEYFRGK